MRQLASILSCMLSLSTASALDCQSIPPSSPLSNLANLQSCLNLGYAKLSPGTFELPTTLNLPNNSVLKGNNSEIKLIGSSDALIRINSNSQVSMLKLNGNHMLVGNSASVVQFEGNNSLLDNSIVYNSDRVGVYFIGRTSTGNKIINSQVRNNFYGIITHYAYTTGNINKIMGSRIYSNSCDGITLVGFGIATSNRIYNNGSNCNNGIKGAGIYSLGNKKGALILSNTIYKNKGHNIDLDSVSNFIIEGNHSYSPGSTSLSLVDSSHNKIRYNVLTNRGTSRSIKNTTAIKSMSFPKAGKAFQDFPHKSKQAISLFMGQRKNAANKTTNNQIFSNSIRAFCSSKDCVGLAYFVSRGTRDNAFIDNNVFGSQFGSRRCGDNNYDGGLKNHECENY